MFSLDHRVISKGADPRERQICLVAKCLLTTKVAPPSSFSVMTPSSRLTSSIWQRRTVPTVSNGSLKWNCGWHCATCFPCRSLLEHLEWYRTILMHPSPGKSVSSEKYENDTRETPTPFQRRTWSRSAVSMMSLMQVRILSSGW